MDGVNKSFLLKIVTVMGISIKGGLNEIKLESDCSEITYCSKTSWGNISGMVKVKSNVELDKSFSVEVKWRESSKEFGLICEKETEVVCVESDTK